VVTLRVENEHDLVAHGEPSDEFRLVAAKLDRHAQRRRRSCRAIGGTRRRRQGSVTPADMPEQDTAERPPGERKRRLMIIRPPTLPPARQRSPVDRDAPRRASGQQRRIVAKSLRAAAGSRNRR
jgi:hypothetical protein